MRSPTIRDVARKAGVGVGTVSRVLNNSPQVSPETRERVLEAIRSLGYRPNIVARQLSKGTRVQTVGVISPFVTDHSFVARLHGMQMAMTASQNDYDLILYNVTTSERYQQRLVTIIEQRMIVGLLVVAMDITPNQRELLKNAGITFVGVNDRIIDEWPSIGADNTVGGEIATEYLLQLGHRKIAYIGDQFPFAFQHQFSVGKARYDGYIRALETHNIEHNPDYVQLGPYSRDVAYRLTTRLLDLPQPPTAIFCMSDVQALGCMAAIRDKGLHVPEDISVMGFDDVEISRLIGLSTIRQNLERGGYLAMKHLLQLLGDTSFGDIPQPFDVPTLPAFEVVERQTTRHYAEN
ncbi:MAG: LacI family transcriptional regulator [Anaerolineae bacterium]|nr:LacI family transcriptional regulator [Anaerolineae bacterium]